MKPASDYLDTKYNSIYDTLFIVCLSISVIVRLDNLKF